MTLMVDPFFLGPFSFIHPQTSTLHGVVFVPALILLDVPMLNKILDVIFQRYEVLSMMSRAPVKMAMSIPIRPATYILQGSFQSAVSLLKLKISETNLLS